MAEFPAPQSGAAAGGPPITAGLLAYALFGTAAVVGLLSSGFPIIAPLLGLIGIGGLIVAYVKRDDARGTWVASHFAWLIRTFWFSFLWAVIGWLLVATLMMMTILGWIVGRKEDLLGRLSTTDPLTGLANRRRLRSAFADELIRAARYDTPLALLLLDLDRL